MRVLVPACPPGAQASATNVRSPSEPPYTAAASPAGPAPSTTRSKRCPSTSARSPSERATCAADGLRITSVACTSTGVSERGMSSHSSSCGALGVRVHVVPAHRQQVALEQVAHLERSPGAARGDQTHDAVSLGLVPRAPRHQRAEHELAELRPARDHLAQPGPVVLDHVRRLDGDAGADRRLSGEHGDVADERAAVGLRDVHVLAGLAVDELDQPALDDVERRVADGVLVEHLAGLERPPLTALGQPRELGLGEPREEDLVAEIGERLAADYGCRRHRRRLALVGATGEPATAPPASWDARSRGTAPH